MPATAGRVRMPANNRVHSSAALQTHSIWQSAIGYDPYAPNKVNKPNTVNKEADNNSKGAQQAVPSSDPKAENAYNSFQGLLALARVTNSNADEARGCCKMCGRVGHLSFQCRNFLSIKDDKDKDLEAIEAAVLAGLDKVKGKGKRRDGVESSEESEDDEEESESSEDSDYDSEIERAIAKNKKYGKNVSSLLKKSSRKKKNKKKDESDDEGRKKRGRSRKRRRSGKKGDSGSDTEDERRHGRRREKRRRRRSHREAEGSDSSEGSDRRRERSSRRRAAEDYNVSSNLEDSRVGRDGKKRYEKESRKQRYEREI